MMATGVLQFFVIIIAQISSNFIVLIAPFVSLSDSSLWFLGTSSSLLSSEDTSKLSGNVTPSPSLSVSLTLLSSWSSLSLLALEDSCAILLACFEQSVSASLAVSLELRICLYDVALTSLLLSPSSIFPAFSSSLSLSRGKSSA
ncbi:hypothetical protein PsorP6_001379 [Peronosclerospora sorghi]|uniref:Uncharacterized protein n=1 Tax=Peronosclerospora sorghi TaxID=230839 RepID=A0ACC0WVM5_9STRA|nr:hypothetical protein PsorP6_001379 [Peronosclerospora sorghi]